ncbi:unnamed protein product [Paramecium sonneborni]|uniref:Uncharacterized protein n=1 Tax=Paramecium sonneborni TaxID=65129 RepID=A0A8S1LEU9_9CILI|nr:unnamed protein product [Paramecium sonneborni]
MKQVRLPFQQKSPRDIGFYKQCQRFQPKERSPQPNEQDASVYAQLRKSGLVKDKALKYCLTDHCRIDASLTKYGPPNYKIFSNSLDKKQIIQGWQMVGKPKEQNYEKFIKAKEDDGLMELQNKEEQIKFERLKDYFIGLSKSNKKVELPKFQMGNGKEHYFELADYYQQIKPLSRTLITDTESFDDIIPKQRRKEFRIEPKVDRSTLRRTEEEKGVIQRLKILNQLIKTYKEAKRADDPSIEIVLDHNHTKFNQDSFTQGIDSLTIIKEYSNNNEYYNEGSDSSRKRCSIITRKYSKITPNDTYKKNQVVQQKLDLFVSKALGRINCQFNGSLFGRDFKNS